MISALRERASALAIGLSLATVSLATGFISYTHISALTEAYWQNWKTAHLMPLAVDGQIVVGSVYFMEHSGEPRRWLGLLGVVPGIMWSLYANWESVSPPAGTPWPAGLEAHVWATVPAQAFACSTILFERWLHSRRAKAPAESRVLPVLAAAPVAMARVAAELSALAGEPAAPGPEPEAVPCRPGVPGLAVASWRSRPAGPPWGLVSPAAAPAAEPGPQDVPESPAAPVAGLFLTGTGWPGAAIPVAGPSQPLPSVRAVPRPKAATAAPGGKLPLPSGETLKDLLDTVAGNEIARLYDISRYKAHELKKQHAAGELDYGEEAACCRSPTPAARLPSAARPGTRAARR